MNKNEYIRITKVETDTVNPNGIDNGYWAEGFLALDIRVGHPIYICRMRNILHPTGRLGEFTSSRVEKIEGNIVHTQNSKYLIEGTEQPKESL